MFEISMNIRFAHIGCGFYRFIIKKSNTSHGRFLINHGLHQNMPKIYISWLKPTAFRIHI